MCNIVSSLPGGIHKFETAMQTATTTNLHFLFHILTVFSILTIAAGRSGFRSELNSSLHLFRVLAADMGKTTLAESQRNVSAQVGSSVKFPCSVNNLRDKKVSWIRGKDLTVLAFDEITYTTDRRFRVLHIKGSPRWILQLRAVKLSDEGLYDCQVNTYPKIATKFYLDVIPVNRATETQREQATLGGNLIGDMRTKFLTELFDAQRIGITLKLRSRSWMDLESGSTLTMTCEASGKWVENQLTSENKVTSDFRQRVIAWNLDRVPLSIIFRKGKYKIEEKWTNTCLESILTLWDVVPAYSGNLSCSVASVVSSPVELIVSDEVFSKSQHYRGPSHREEIAEVSQGDDGSVSSEATALRSFGTKKLTFLSFSVMLFIFLVTYVASLYVHSFYVVRHQQL